MRQIQDLISDALLAIGSDAGLIAGLAFANKRYHELASRLRFRHLRRRGEFVIPARVVTGEATFTQGSQLVIGDADAQAAWLALGHDGLRGRWISPNFQPVLTWAELEGLDGDGNLIMREPWPTATLAAGGYALVPRYFRLAAGTVWLGPFTIPRLNYRLKLAPQAELDWRAAGHFLQAGFPEYVTLAPPDPEDGRRRVEIYPPGAQTEVVSYTYYTQPPTLTLTTPCPDGLNPTALTEGILIDLMRRKWAQSVEAKDYEGAAHWRNEFNSQRTKWDRDYVALAGDTDLPVSDEATEVRLSERNEQDWLYDQMALGQWPSFM